MPEVVLHLGAHRTGTTSLQRYLQFHQNDLHNQGIQLVFPPASRELPLQNLAIRNDRVLISEENMLGTMEGNLQQAMLYPDVKIKLARYSQLLMRVDIVFMSIRDLADWWTSAISFCVSRKCDLPSNQTLERIADSPRGWSDIVTDVRQIFPNARVVVREFGWKMDNPKQQLRQLTKWPAWDETTGIKKSHNRRPTTNAIAMAMVDRSDFDGLSRLPSGGDFQPFGEKQLEALHSRYAADLEALGANTDIELWRNSDLARDTRRRRHETAETNDEGADSATCFLHIGKTGGTFLKSLALENDDHASKLYVGKHGDTLTTTIRDFGRHRKLGFFFRNPEDRFISGFQSRLRRGRPTYNVDWTSGEAAAFSFFATPNDLAEALTSDDERLKSAASFAFGHIFHLKHGYAHYLNSSEAVLYEHKMENIVVCCETKNIDDHLTRILGELRISIAEKHGGEKNAARRDGQLELSKLARSNLRSYWQTEFQIYNTCKVVARDLAFAE